MNLFLINQGDSRLHLAFGEMNVRLRVKDLTGPRVAPGPQVASSSHEQGQTASHAMNLARGAEGSKAAVCVCRAVGALKVQVAFGLWSCRSPSCYYGLDEGGPRIWEETQSRASVPLVDPRNASLLLSSSLENKHSALLITQLLNTDIHMSRSSLCLSHSPFVLS